MKPITNRDIGGITMNDEYKRRINRANDAANQFFQEVKKSGNIKMLMDGNDSEIHDLYFEALDVTKPASDEEKDFYFQFSAFLRYRMLFLLHSGELFDRKVVGNRKSFTVKELQPIYDDLTGILDDAIKENDRNKAAYLEEKNFIISDFNEELEKAGYSIKQQGGCYIATAVYGSYDCPQVWILRRYRDGVLAKNFFGRIFIRCYYFISPMLVKWFGNKLWFTQLCRRPLDTIIYGLKNRGYADTPYTDNSELQ